MSIARILFEISVNLFQSTIYMLFLKKCVPITRDNKLADLACVIACTAFFTLYLFFDIPVTDSLNVVIYFIWLCFVSNERWYVLGMWAMVKEIVVVATVGFMLATCQMLIGATHAMLMEPGSLRIVFVISTNLVLFLALFVFSRRIQKDRFPLAVPALLYFLGTNIAVFFSIEMLFSMQVLGFGDNDWHIFAAYGAMFACSVLSVLLYHTMTAVAQKENQSQIALNQAQMTKQHQQVLQDIYQDTIARQHDFKHQLQTIEQLVAKGNSEMAQKYLAEYEKQVSSSEAFITGSIAVDALLTAKQLACRRNDIEFHITQYPLNDLPIPEVDFCAVVGNLLDNAIEGVNRISEPLATKRIHLSFHRIWDTFTIHCENDIAPESIKRNAKGFFTSKQEHAEIHGFGIRNIEYIVKNADGCCSFETENNKFLATVALPYPVREGK